MSSKSTSIGSIEDIALAVLSGAVFARDFLPVRDLVRPKSKLRLALDRGVSNRIERELPRSLLDPDLLDEQARAEYDAVAEDIRNRFGNRIREAPFDPPRELIEELAERAISTGSYASAADALEFLGTRNKHIGELVASAVRTLKSAGSPGPSEEGPPDGSSSSLTAVAESLITAVRLKNPLEPLFQSQALDFHFKHPANRETFYKALVSGNDDGAVGIGLEYLLGDREIAEAVRNSLSRTAARKAFFRELARALSGGKVKLDEFLAQYRASVDVMRAGGAKPDPAAVQNALAGGAWDEADGIGLLGSLAVTHPVSALVCRTILVPRQGHYLIPIVFENNSALDVLGLI